MRLKRQIPGSQKIILGFILIILIGTGLLMLPIASREGQTTTLSGAMLTSVSATCVTGLISYDTWTHWTLFGQLVILTEIQVGGLGFITIGTFMMILLGKRIGVSHRTLIQDSLSTLQLKGGVLLVRRIIKGTFILEAGGAVLLATRFIPRFGVLKGIYFSIFHAVSAFCNAGFDLMGAVEPFSSLCHFYGDPIVMLTLSALIIIGGLGFMVWEDLHMNHYHWQKYRFHTKLVISTTTILLIASTLCFYFFERNNFLAGMNGLEKFLAAFFSAVTPRTAGFNSIDTASLSNGSLFLTIILMFIGGSPGSTAGGIKTVTLAVIILYIRSYLLHEKDTVAFKSRIDDDNVRKASVVIFINLICAILGVLIILGAQTLPLRDVLFEVFSAIGTAGMSTGVTRQLCLVSKCVVMSLMFLGRMGSLTFAMSFTERKKSSKVRYPSESIVVG